MCSVKNTIVPFSGHRIRTWPICEVREEMKGEMGSHWRFSACWESLIWLNLCSEKNTQMQCVSLLEQAPRKHRPNFQPIFPQVCNTWWHWFQSLTLSLTQYYSSFSWFPFILFFFFSKFYFIFLYIFIIHIILGGYRGKILIINKWKRICSSSENVDNRFEELVKEYGRNGSEKYKRQIRE